MKRNADLRLLSFLTIFSLVGGSSFYRVVEGWSWLDSVYFSLITLTTVGYGDIVPTTPASKLFTMIYVFVGVGIMFGFIHAVARRALKRARRNGMEIEKKKLEAEKKIKKVKRKVKRKSKR